LLTWRAGVAVAEPAELRRQHDAAQDRLRRLARNAERSGWLMLAAASHRALAEVAEAFAEDAEFRASRGIQ
jgi:hypothetical protein